MFSYSRVGKSEVFRRNGTVFIPRLVNKEQIYSGQLHEIF